MFKARPTVHFIVAAVIGVSMGVVRSSIAGATSNCPGQGEPTTIADCQPPSSAFWTDPKGDSPWTDAGNDGNSGQCTNVDGNWIGDLLKDCKDLKSLSGNGGPDCNGGGDCGSNSGSSGSTSATVPEPAEISLAAIAGLGILSAPAARFAVIAKLRSSSQLYR